jgi:hypothetical protein
MRSKRRCCRKDLPEIKAAYRDAEAGPGIDEQSRLKSFVRSIDFPKSVPPLSVPMPLEGEPHMRRHLALVVAASMIVTKELGRDKTWD